MIITATRADEIVPGDTIASRDVLGFFDTVVSVRYIEHTTGEDEVEITLNTRAICKALVRRVSRMLDVVE